MCFAEAHDNQKPRPRCSSIINGFWKRGDVNYVYWPKRRVLATYILLSVGCSLWPVPDVPGVSDMWLLIISASPTVFQPPAPTPGSRAPEPGLWRLPRQPPRAQNRQCCFNQLVDICRDSATWVWWGSSVKLECFTFFLGKLDLSKAKH